MVDSSAGDVYVPAGSHRPQLIGTLTAYDFSDVSIWFEDGSEWRTTAKVVREGDFVVVYTEHLGYHVFHSLVGITWTEASAPIVSHYAVDENELRRRGVVNPGAFR